MRTRTVVMALAIALMASSCAANRGDQLAGELSERLEGVDGIERVELDGNNVLPFAGDASGTIVLEDGISTARAAEIAAILEPYVSGESPDYALTLGIDGVDLQVSPSEERNASGLRLLDEVRQRTDLSSATIVYGAGSQACVVAAEAEASADPVTVYDGLVALRAATPGCERAGVRVTHGEDQSITDAADHWEHVDTLPEAVSMTEPLAGLREIRNRFDVVSYAIRPGALVLEMRRGKDVVAADELARKTPGQQVSVSGGKISAWSQDVPAAQLVLDLAALSSVGSVSSDDRGLQIDGVDLDDILAIYQQVAQDPEAAGISRILISGTAAGEKYQIAGPPDVVAERVAAAPRLAAYAPFALADDDLSVHVAVDEISDMVGVIKPLAGVGRLVTVRDDQGREVTFRSAGDEIEVSEGEQREEVRPLLDAIWRAWQG
ncbi:hypothetical protein [Nocardioides panzhihuensis]|uniref:Uncharacterized protein n=1 Tax=Nocardioides panzhihuensis TaxID=860243 RepID=A0A7Z0DK34_9ACTN|nr:hypothetical protein [Nocardioides panzhihuensis]NYI76862.1 hypothetical protein [Nocardioides panzhihuensis]